jgi:hypothetical protein
MIADLRFLQDDVDRNQDNYKTNPPSEIYNLWHDNTPLHSNAGDDEYNMFNINYSNRDNCFPIFGRQTNKSTCGTVEQETSMSSNLLHFQSPSNQRNSLYTSSYFLIPTHTSNLQHRSAAFHEDITKNLTFEENNHDSWMGGDLSGKGIFNTGGLGGNCYLNGGG